MKASPLFAPLLPLSGDGMELECRPRQSPNLPRIRSMLHQNPPQTLHRSVGADVNTGQGSGHSLGPH